MGWVASSSFAGISKRSSWDACNCSVEASEERKERKRGEDERLGEVVVGGHGGELGEVVVGLLLGVFEDLEVDVFEVEL